MLRRTEEHINEPKLDFVGIGAPRSATTWVYSCLAEHPNIELTKKDSLETAFFSGFGAKPEIKKENKVISGEFMVHYLTEPGVASRMYSYNPNIKIIVCLRNPIDRAYSQYRHSLFVGEGAWKSFEESIEKSPEIIIEPGLYYKHLSDFYAKFAESNIFIVWHDDITGNEGKLISKLYNFLGVDDSFVPKSIGIRLNPGEFKHTIVGRIVHKGLTPLLERSSTGRRIKSSPRLRKLYYMLVGKTKQPKEQMLGIVWEKLEKIYREDITQLERLTGKDLKVWF
jgi:hypothetical protein